MSPSNELNHNCDAILELLPDYAFGLTSAEETRLVEANLPHCPEAAAQLADYRTLQVEMRTGVPQIEPPTQLGERLMAAIATPPMPAKPQPRRPLPLAWLAAAAAFIALLLSNFYWMNRVDELTRRHEALLTQFPTPASEAFIFTRASDIRWVRLPPSQENTAASALLMWNAESEIGLLYVQDFPQLEPGRIYQLWFTREGERVSAGTFRVNEQGNGVLVFYIDEAIDEYTWSRITEEPEDGSAQPTGTVVVNGEL